MTAEVVIMNGNGVALAADSAVTIGSHKIYNSAVKSFALTKSAPVAAMIYGGALLLSVPWETVIKGYRAQLGDRKFKTTKEYAADLIKYIQTCRYFSDQSQQKWLTHRTASCFHSISKTWVKLAEAEIKKTGKGLTPAAAKKLLKENLKAQRKYLDGLDPLSVPPGKLTKIRKLVSGAADVAGDSVFPGLYPELRAELRAIAWSLFDRVWFPRGHSGLVIAGFGEDEIFPSVVTMEIEGIVSGFLRYRIDEVRTTKIDDDSEASIIPFAQEDMVRTFMEGLNPGFRRFVDGYLGEVFKDMPKALCDAMGVSAAKRSAVSSKLKSACDAILADFHKHSEEHRTREHVDPVLQMVAVLPKDELAAMAEALVNLTAFKRRVTGSLETVGGPVDVCVITKGDGLVWVKRKHYFPAELNHHFFAKYNS